MNKQLCSSDKQAPRCTTHCKSAWLPLPRIQVRARSRPLTRSRSCGALGSHSTQLARLPDKVTGCAEAQGATSISRSAADSDAAGRLPLLSLSRCSRASSGTGMLKMETSPLPCATARSPSLYRMQSAIFTHTHGAATHERVVQHSYELQKKLTPSMKAHEMA